VNSDTNRLDLAKQRYRVMQGDEIIGQFSNRQLAEQRAKHLRGAIVLDVLMEPPKVVYKDGKWLEKAW
jgi:hypothetical protein